MGGKEFMRQYIYPVKVTAKSEGIENAETLLREKGVQIGLSEPEMREIRRTEIYYADLNPVKGSEQGGLRPVLILQNDIGNRHSPATIVAAITSRCSKANT